MRYTQPQGNSRINWSNPITKELVSVLNSRGCYFDVSGINSGVFNNTSFTNKVSSAGVGTQGAVYPQFPLSSSISADSNITLASVLHNTGSWDAQDRINVRATYTNVLRILTAVTGWQVTVTTLAGTITVNTGNTDQIAKIVCSHDLKSGVLTVCINGKMYSGTQTADSMFEVAISGLQVVTFSPVIHINHVLWKRALSEVEMVCMSANPWQIFADDKKPIFIGVGAAPSGLSITVDLATASASGYAATVNRQSVISSTLATATASGFTANVGTGNAITATLATATASGQTATVNRQSNITATQAVASASGQIATVNRQLAVAATLATATASGQTATVNLQRQVVATQAAAAATGYAANVQLGNDLSISATQAAATASGFDAAINRQLSIAATLTTATASGFDASISNGASIAASYGLASADGYQAQVNLQREIAASLATASASGFTAAISTSTGTAVWPTPDQVLSGITYGPTGADYTGTATAGGYPTAADIAAAVRADLSAELARMDVAISSRATVAAIMGATAP